MFDPWRHSPSRQLLADLVDGAEEMRAHRTGAEAEMLGDFFEGEIFVVAEAEDHLLLRRESPLRALNGRAQLHGEQLPLRIRTLVDRFQHGLALAVVLAAREQADEPPPAQRIAAAIDGDARQPRLQLRASFEAGQMRVGLDERVL